MEFAEAPVGPGLLLRGLKAEELTDSSAPLTPKLDACVVLVKRSPAASRAALKASRRGMSFPDAVSNRRMNSA